MGETVAIIPCTNQKSDEPGKARDVWIGNHFQLVLAHTEMFYDKILVMSYKYGLIDPDQWIEPYDIDMRTARAAERLRWWFGLKGDIKKLSEEKPLLVALYTGNLERTRIITEFIRNDIRQVIVPFEGATVGQRMALVYDCIPPFDLDKAEGGGYELAEDYGTAPAGGKYQAPATMMTDTIEWEE